MTEMIDSHHSLDKLKDAMQDILLEKNWAKICNPLFYYF